MFADASLACLQSIPGHPLESSAGIGWTSLLIGLHRSDPTRTSHETAPTSDLTLGVAVTGQHYLEVLENGTWQGAAYGPGACGLSPPYDADRLRWSSGEPFDTAHLYLPGLIVEQAAEHLRRAGQHSAAAALTALVFDDPAVTATAHALLTAARAGTPDLYAEQAAQWLAVHLLTTRAGAELRDPPQAGYLLTDARLARVIDLIRARYGEPLSVDLLASEAGVSRFHFARLFRLRTGYAPHAFLTEMRMNAARQLLQGSDLPIARVAERCGYRPDQFGAAFKRACGKTPSAFRQLRQGDLPSISD